MAKCPACDANLERKEIEKVTMDICAGCGGVWFGPGQFGELIKDHQVPALEEADPLQASEEPVHAPTFCIGCGQRLMKAAHGTSLTIFVYRCIACGGTFLPHDQLVPLHNFEEKRAKSYLYTQETRDRMPQVVREALAMLDAEANVGAIKTERLLQRIAYSNNLASSWGSGRFRL